MSKRIALPQRGGLLLPLRGRETPGKNASQRCPVGAGQNGNAGLFRPYRGSKTTLSLLYVGQGPRLSSSHPYPGLPFLDLRSRLLAEAFFFLKPIRKIRSIRGSF